MLRRKTHLVTFSYPALGVGAYIVFKNMAEHGFPPRTPQRELTKSFDISNFNLNAILRGAELTVVGAHRALQNPAFFTSRHYKQASLAVIAGIAIHIVIALPLIVVKALLWCLSTFVNFETWDNKLINGLDFVQNYVLQLPFFLMTLMKYLTPTLDDMFMDSLQWVDQTYIIKHKDEDRAKLRGMYCQNLRLYSTRDSSTHSKSLANTLKILLLKLWMKAATSLGIFCLSYLPVIGRFVLPGVSFYAFKKAVGLGPAALIFGTSIFLPRRFLVVFLQSYFTSRTLMRDLLEPYFSRIRFTKEQKKHWFRDREGLLFGFGVGFYILMKIPLLGVLVYGIAEASTAYLITKITDPPPPPMNSEGFAESQQRWENKHEFLRLSLSDLEVQQPLNHNSLGQKGTKATFTAMPHSDSRG